MSLVDDIRSLRDRVLADLNAAHDYYNDTVFTWNFVQGRIRIGDTFTFQNVLTGTMTMQAELAQKLQRYISAQLTQATFQQLISMS